MTRAEFIYALDDAIDLLLLGDMEDEKTTEEWMDDLLDRINTDDYF